MVDIHPAAADEMADAADWYEERVDGLGARFLAAVRATFDRISEAPEAGAPLMLRQLPSSMRRRPVDGFPFSVVYEAEPRVVVVAVAHMKRRPGYWRARLR